MKSFKYLIIVRLTQKCNFMLQYLVNSRRFLFMNEPLLMEELLFMEIKEEAKIDNLIALCYLVYDYEEFYQKFIQSVITFSDKYREFIEQLYDISKGKFRLGAKQIKRFYNENKLIIDIINEYSNIVSFMNDIYNCRHCKLKFLYEYISSHRGEIDKILAVLAKLKELGFDKLEFAADLDFTQESYKIYALPYDNFYITYLDNLIVIPSYDPDVVSYKTKGSSYKMRIEFSVDNISESVREIVLNDLIFDPSRLPKAITIEEIFKKVVSLANDKTREYFMVEDSINLSVSIEELYAMFNSVSATIDELENIDKKQELIDALSNIREAILKMQAISNEYSKKLVTDNDIISETLLEKGRRAHSKRKSFKNLTL